MFSAIYTVGQRLKVTLELPLAKMEDKNRLHMYFLNLQLCFANINIDKAIYLKIVVYTIQSDKKKPGHGLWTEIFEV